MTSVLYHGGVPGLRPGDLISPAHERRVHPGCKFCEARAAGTAHLGVDGPTPAGWVYGSPSRLYAKHYASLWGRGDLYRVRPVGDWERSGEDSIESYRAAGAVVVSVLERAVLLTPSERRRLWRAWTEADRAKGWLR